MLILGAMRKDFSKLYKLGEKLSNTPIIVAFPWEKIFPNYTS
ncbi:MAG: hypothetical protein HeimC3_30740 [Candidatus Heimdallarchaeota archaeon LC_3]|nr:MAG: hypothetical protein HeimC3_30740 [Candidatus Heimdallarchaeota archaeon LC_3]